MDDAVLHAVAGLLRRQRWATLATVRDGQPLAAHVACAVEADLTGVLLHLSKLSAHTRQLLAEPRAALALGEPDDGRPDPQTLARVTLEGTALPLERGGGDWQAARTRYLERLPEAQLWFEFADFTLFRFTVRRARFVGGFANAHTLRPADLVGASSLGPAG